MPMIFDHRRNKVQEEKPYDGPVSIYAELSKKQLGLIQQGSASIEVPFGTSMKKSGSRGLYFHCDSVDIATELKDGLDASSINWQEE